MSSCASFTFFYLFFFLTSFRAFAQNPIFLRQFCSNTTTYSRNSTYFTNLKTLLSSFSSPNALYSTGFQNSTAGQAPDKVTGLFLCRGDVTTEVCRNCVNLSVKETLNRCPNGKETVIYYEECMLRYSHRNILSTVTYNGGHIMLINPNNAAFNQEHRFEDLVWSTMNQAANEAASSPRKFYTGKVDSLYVMVQCTPDLRRAECLRCLQNSINQLSFYRFGGRLLWPSCNSRYELYPFYNQTAAGTPLLPPASSPPESSAPRPHKLLSPGMISLVVIVSFVVIILIGVGVAIFKRREQKQELELPTESVQFELKTIEAATSNFSEHNKLGKGGFGEVYKGLLLDGTEIAVKRLSKTSGQGEVEFKNEVIVVAKLQHRNLVRLLGFSLQGEEKLLVYEFVPNQSLDYFLFDRNKRVQLDWTMRCNIIGGITRGILYLHQDSRLKIIHRDLKASNVLLDAEMNPKIADFGMARIFGVDQTVANTARVVGTFGYMSPEYVTHGQFSIKSDVYSFGVLILEIISGRKNSSFYQMNGLVNNLVTYVWRIWEDKALPELIDPIIREDCNSDEVIRYIHIGLLCVQENPADRPTMPTIHQMLTTSSMTLPVPLPPGFFFGNGPTLNPSAQGLEPGQLSSKSTSSVDTATITDVTPR